MGIGLQRRGHLGEPLGRLGIGEEPLIHQRRAITPGDHADITQIEFRMVLHAPENAAARDRELNRLHRAVGIAGQHGSLLRDSTPLDYAEFPCARTASPLMLEVTEAARDIYRAEIFGPVSFVIKSDTIDDCLREATTNARERGAITSHVYSVDEDFLERAVDAYHAAGASVACNLVGMPINFAAAYSDYHVTGLNPAGNACLADLAFVANRFRIVQSKRMI